MTDAPVAWFAPSLRTKRTSITKDCDRRDNNNNIIIIIIIIIIVIIITIIQILFLITNLTIKSYLQLISLKKLFSQSNVYNSFRLKKERHLISIEKIHSIKNIYIRKKNNVNKLKI